MLNISMRERCVQTSKKIKTMIISFLLAAYVLPHLLQLLMLVGIFSESHMNQEPLQYIRHHIPRVRLHQDNQSDNVWKYENKDVVLVACRIGAIYPNNEPIFYTNSNFVLQGKAFHLVGPPGLYAPLQHFERTICPINWYKAISFPVAAIMIVPIKLEHKGKKML